MQGGGVPQRRARPIVYCLVPGDLAPRLHDTLRRHFRDEPGVEVIVERRAGARRRLPDRRTADDRAGPDSERERRAHGAAAGRRVGERRASLVPVSAPPLPRRVRAHAARLAFVERMEPSDQQLEDQDTARLVLRIQAGERELFGVLYMRYFDRVYGYLRMLFRDPHEAEDAAQQVFLRALEALPRYQSRPEPFRGWLFVIARNHARTQIERLSRVRLTDAQELRQLGDAGNGEAGDPSVVDWITDRELQLFVERLPLVQRQVLFLRHAVDLTMAQIAAVLGQSPAAVRQHHTRALRFLRTRFAAVDASAERRRGDQAGMHLLPRRSRVLRLRRYGLISPGPTG
jgi:RNA polymerase sigma-70 factor (ECF subfamily)